jgi:hypothetical protein
MMWHWNSLWAPAPGDPPALGDPELWKSVWSPEQAIALQARSWEALLSAAHSWWAMMLSAWPVGAAGAWPLPAWSGAPVDAAATAGAEPLRLNPAPEAAAAAPATRARAPRKRAAAARKR